MTVADQAHAADQHHLEPEASAPRARGAWWWQVGEVVAVLVLPLVVFVVLEVEPYFLQNGIDPFLYVGYTENLDDLVARYGYPYYAVRFGLILPGRLATSLFGAVGGHLVLRYLLAVLAAGSVVVLAHRLRCRAAGWFAAVCCLTSPVFLRALMTTYSDTVVVPCLLAGLAFLLVPSRRSWAWAAAAGLVLGVAVNANPVVALLLVVVLGARLVLQLLRGERRALVDLAVAVVGVLVVTAAGMAYYQVRFGDGNVLGPSIEASRQLSGQATAVFRSPDLRWLGDSPHLYLPVLALVLLVGVVATRRRPAGGRWRALLAAPVADVGVLLVAVLVFFAHQQFLAGRYLLETYYYASYLLPFVVLALLGALVELAGRPGFGTRGVWVATAVVGLLPLARNVGFDGLQLWVWPTVPLLVVAVALALVAARWWRGALVVAGVVVAAGVVLLAVAPPRDLPAGEGAYVRQDPRYFDAIGNPSRSGLHTLELADQLVEAVPAWSDDPGSVVFWYPESSLIDSVQSAYLWRSTALQHFLDPMPALTDQQRNILLGRTPRHLVLLAPTTAEIDEGRAAIEALGLVPEQVADHTLTAGDLTLQAEVLTFAAAPCDQEWDRTSPFPPAWLGLPGCP